MASKAHDQYEDHVLTKVEDDGDHYILDHDGWCLAVEKAKFRTPPRAGQTARFYGGGIGRPVRGLDVDGVEVYYEDETAYQSRMADEQGARDAETKAKADANRAARDARVAALPFCFQKRIARFRRNLPSFYWQHEDYEMAACVDAVKIANALGAAVDIPQFTHLSWKEQKEMVPGLDDGHSGNTFAMACRLASHYLTDERLVFAEHAAISALLGCQGAGCPLVTDAEMRAAGYEPFRR